LRNLGRIRRHRRLSPAADLYGEAGRAVPDRPRSSSEGNALRIDGDLVYATDQDPLQLKYAVWGPGWDGDRLLREINRRVFFWSGDGDGPRKPQGVNHFNRYRKLVELRRLAGLAVVRVAYTDLRDANRGNEPEFSLCNSGTLSPRAMEYNVRDDETFLPRGARSGTPSKVCEVTFLQAVALPASTQVSVDFMASWRTL
jgi:hypothetical protein